VVADTVVGGIDAAVGEELEDGEVCPLTHTTLNALSHISIN